jgi:hypothetical protein
VTDRSPFLWTVSLAVVGALASPALPSCGNSPGGGGGFGDDTSSGSSGSSSSGGGDSAVGSSSGSSGASSGSSGASSGSSGGSGSSSSGSSSGSSDAGTSHYVPTCGRPCDLRSNTCCLPADGGSDASYCLNGNSVSCGTDVATFHCGGVTDCPSGEICCGQYDLAALTASTVCQPPNCALAQFCETSAECPKGVECIAQSCMYGAKVYLCGLKSGPPYNCVAQ